MAVLLELPADETNLFLISADAGVADAIDPFQRAFNGGLAAALGIVGVTRWLRAAPPLRRLLWPTLAGAVAALILAVQVYYEVIAGGFIRASQEVTSIVLVSVPPAFLAGLLSAKLARAGVADLIVALQQAPDASRTAPQRRASRSPTTASAASAAPATPSAPACAGWPTASRRSAAGCA